MRIAIGIDASALPVIGQQALPGASYQTLYLPFDGSVGSGTFTRNGNAINPETLTFAGNNMKPHSEFEGGVGDLSTLLNVSIGSLTGFTNAAVFASGAAAKYFQWGTGLTAPVVGEYRIYSCYIQMADLSAPDPSTGVVAGKDMYISQGAFFPTYIGKELVDAANAIYRVYWASAAGDTSVNCYLQQPATGSGKSFKVSGCMIERAVASQTTPSTYIRTTSTSVYNPRYVTGKQGQSILLEESSTNVFLNSSTAVTQNISVTTANSGKWTTTVYGAGQVTTSAGTATATGYGVATVGTPNTITVTGNGTVTFTVSGATSATIVNVENLPYGTSPIITYSASATRADETLTYPTSGVLSASAGTVMVRVYVDTAKQAATTKKTIFAHLNTNNAIKLYHNALANQWGAETSNNTGTLSEHIVTSVLSSGWHHIAMTWSSAELALYLDGTKQASPIASPNLPASLAATLNVGSNTGGAEQIDMPLDNVRFFSIPFTSEQILTYSNRGR